MVLLFLIFVECLVTSVLALAVACSSRSKMRFTAASAVNTLFLIQSFAKALTKFGLSEAFFVEPKHNESKYFELLLVILASQIS